MLFCFFFCKQKTAYEMRISDWSSDVCSSDLPLLRLDVHAGKARARIEDVAVAIDVGIFRHAFGNVEFEVETGSVDRELAFLRSPFGGYGGGCAVRIDRSEERRVGKECVSTF